MAAVTPTTRKRKERRISVEKKQTKCAYTFAVFAYGHIVPVVYIVWLYILAYVINACVYLCMLCVASCTCVFVLYMYRCHRCLCIVTILHT